MTESSIEGVVLTPLDIIDTPGGDVLHAMKRSASGYSGFGEAYFSTIESGVVKAWKRHKLMTLNIVVPVGSIRFVIYDERNDSITNGRYQEIIISRKNYQRITIPPMLWMGFQGIDENTSMLLNIADVEHDPNEADRKEENEFDFNWSLGI